MKLEELTGSTHHEATGEINLAELRQSLDNENRRSFNKSMDFARHSKGSRRPTGPGRIPSGTNHSSDFYASSFADSFMSSFAGESFALEESFAFGDGDEISLARNPPKRNEKACVKRRSSIDLDAVLVLEEEFDDHESSKDPSTNAEGENEG